MAGQHCTERLREGLGRTTGPWSWMTRGFKCPSASVGAAGKEPGREVGRGQRESLNAAFQRLD